MEYEPECAPIAFRCLIEEGRREQITGPLSVGSDAPHWSGYGLMPCWSGYAFIVALVTDSRIVRHFALYTRRKEYGNYHGPSQANSTQLASQSSPNMRQAEMEAMKPLTRQENTTRIQRLLTHFLGRQFV